MLQKDLRLDHSADINLTYIEAIVDEKLKNLRSKMISKDHSLCIGEYFDKLDSMVNSPLYECFKLLPKPAVHHAHLTASATVDYLI